MNHSRTSMTDEPIYWADLRVPPSERDEPAGSFEEEESAKAEEREG